jgi:hypothetical protein
MTVARFILSLAILLLAAYVVVMNWGCVIVSMRNRRRGIDRHHSTVPLFSFFLAVVALILYPHPNNKVLWMLAVPMLDIAHLNLVLFVLLLPVMLIRGLRKKRIAEAGKP